MNPRREKQLLFCELIFYKWPLLQRKRIGRHIAGRIGLLGLLAPVIGNEYELILDLLISGVRTITTISRNNHAAAIH